MTTAQTGQDVLPNGYALDTTALTEHVRRSDVRAFFREFSRRFPSLKGSAFERGRRIMIRIGAVAVVIGGLAMASGIAGEISSDDPDKPAQLGGMSVVMLLFLVAGGVLWWWTVRTSRRRGTPRSHFRLVNFARRNGLQYFPTSANGSHLEPWAKRGLLLVSRVMRMGSPTGTVEIGNYELAYATTSNGQAQFGGYCAARLDRTLPNIVLRAVRRRSPLTESGVPARSQRLGLEGDFDRHFRLYCPEGYERDALYLFTPDVMARLIDRADGFDVEIVDDWVFISQAKDFVTLDPQRWRAVNAAVGALRGKIAQWERWKDDRLLAGDAASVPDARVIEDEVAAPGRRLRAGWGWSLAMLGVVVVLIALIQLLRLL